MAKDGKRLVDCEGYSAVTEKVLGGIQKNGKPMFEVMNGAGGGHVITGVFPHGGDPLKGFIVSNDEVKDVKWDPLLNKDYNATQNTETRQRFIVRNYWQKKF